MSSKRDIALDSSIETPVRHPMVRSRSVLPILALCTAFIGLDGFLIVPLVPTIAENVGFSPTIGGLLVTAYTLVYAISAPIFGVFSDRINRKTTMILGMVLLALGTLLTPLGNSLPLLLVFRALTGLGAGILQPAVYAMVGDSTTYEKRGQAMGIVMGGLLAGGTLGVPLGSLLAEAFSWQLSFLIIGLLVLFMSVIIAVGLPAIPRSVDTSAPRGTLGNTFRAVFSNREVFFALLATLIWYGGMQGMFTNQGVFYVQHFQLQPSQLGLIMAIGGPSGMIGGILGGKMADRWGKKRIIALAILAATLLIIALPFSTQSLLFAVTISTVWAAAFNAGQISLGALVSELRPELRGLVLSLNSSAMYLGSTLFTASAALLLQFGGFYGIAFINVLGNVAVFFIVRLVLVEKGAQAKE